jgi:hypothetical protein
VTTTGFPIPSLGESGALPTGVTFADNHDGTATLAGTPAFGTHGIYPITIAAANGLGNNAVQNFTLTISTGPAITNASSTIFAPATTSTFTITTAGVPAPSLTESGALPLGVSFVDNHDGTATLSGTPAAGTGGDYALVITAHNGAGADATQNFTLGVNLAPAVTSSASRTFVTSRADSFMVTTSGVPAPSLTEDGALPSGVTFVDNHDGMATLAGTPGPTSGGLYSFTITASNGVGADATQNFELTVQQPSTITSATSAAFNEAVANAFTFTTRGFPSSSLTEAGALPPGVNFVDNQDGTATLSGSPPLKSGGIYNLVVTASNGVGASAVQNFTLTVLQTPAITTSNEATFVVGVKNTIPISATGVPFPFLSEVGALPAGLNFVDNHNGTATLSGTAAARSGGIYNLTITASNRVLPNAVQNFTLIVNESPSIITGVNHKTFVPGTPGTFLVTSAGFPTPTLSEVGALPAGIRFVDNGDGTATLSGTAAAGTDGTYDVTIRAANFTGPTTSQNFYVYVVAGTPPVVVPPRLLSLRRIGGQFQTTELILSFDQPMSVLPADLLTNYIIQPVVRGKVVSGPRAMIRIRRAVYSPDGQTVRLTLARRLSVSQIYQITVNGHAPSGLRNENGVLLDGNGSGSPGSDLVMRFSGQASFNGISGPGLLVPTGFAVRSLASRWGRGALKSVPAHGR